MPDTLALPPAVQVDTLATPVPIPPDTLDAETRTLPDTLVNRAALPADTVEAVPDAEAVLRTPPPPVVALPSLRAGPPLTGAPVRQPVFTPGAQLAPIPGAFRYDLGVYGAAEGVAMGLTAPNRWALTLDGRPVTELFTGRPALELLPEDLLAPIHLDPGTEGSPEGLATELRAFAAAIPITELRYRSGPNNHQFVGATHTQTRRPNFIRRVGGDRARMSVLFHVGGQRGGQLFTNTDVSGWQVVGRVGVALPGLALEVTERHLRRTAGTWGGVDSQAPDPYVATAPVLDPIGEREVITNDLSVRAAVPLFSGAPPLSASAYWVASTHRHTALDTTQAAGDVYGLVLEQPVLVADHRLRVRLDLRAGRVRSGTAFPAGGEAVPPELHASVTDSLAIAGIGVALRAGWHASPDASFPSAGVDVSRALGPVVLDASAVAGGARLAPAERLGFGASLVAEPPAGERVLGARAGLAARVGPLRTRLAAEVRRQSDPRLLVMETEDVARSVTASGALDRGLATLELGLRDDALRGLYASAWGAAQILISVDDSPLHRREAEALPEYWGHGRLGFRAMQVFDGALDLDVFVRGRAWTRFRSRVPHGPTGLLALPTTEAPLVPASGALDVVVEAGLGGGRALVFVAYENALSGVAYPGVFVVPLYPLAQPAIRLGVFWVLPG